MTKKKKNKSSTPSAAQTKNPTTDSETKPAPTPADLPPLPASITTTAATGNSAQDDEFTQEYMRQIVREFGDDIDAVRLSADFLANPGQALEVLIDGLRMGVERVPRELRGVGKGRG